MLAVFINNVNVYMVQEITEKFRQNSLHKICTASLRGNPNPSLQIRYAVTKVAACNTGLPAKLSNIVTVSLSQYLSDVS